MKTKLLFGLLLLIFINSCQHQNSVNKEASSDLIITKIKNLKTDKEKSEYLHQLWEADQGIRKGQGAELGAKYGFDSKEYKEYVEQAIKTDRSVFHQLKLYLEIHAYPNQPRHYHELALNAFPTIIGHHHNFKAQNEVLSYIYKAYKAGKCPLDDIVWIMGEMHESLHRGERLQMSTSKFSTEEEFVALNKALELGLELNEK